MKGRQIFTAVPLADESETKDNVPFIQATQSEHGLLFNRKAHVSSLLKITLVCILISASYKLLKVEKEPYATLTPGGGRDWSLDLDAKTIVSKHHPELALGSLHLNPLVLTSRGDENALKFNLKELEKLEKGVIADLPLGLQFSSNFDTFDQTWDYLLTGTQENSNGQSDVTDDTPSLELEYIDENFLLLHHLDQQWVLDVSFWKFEKGNTVNFVKATDNPRKSWLKPKPETLLYGGGRDWQLNSDDGSISPKNKPDLVLGKGQRNLCLVPSKSDAVWKFDDLDTLKNNGVMKLESTSGSKALKKTENEKYFQQWRYISSIVHEESGEHEAVQVKYVDDNYVELCDDKLPEEKSLVLDVSFWNMVPYMPVNYVGGWKYREN